MPKKESLFSLKTLLFSFQAANTILITFLPLYLAKVLGFSGTQIGWVLAVGPLASIISQPFWGYMSDKYKTVKKMLVICTWGMIVSSVIFFNTETLVAVLVTAFLFYFFTTPIGGLSDSLAQRRASEIGVSFGSIRTWGSIGFASSALIVGQVLDRTGIEYILWPLIIVSIVVLWASHKVKDIKVDSDPISLKDVSKLFKNIPFITFLFFLMFITISHRTNDSFIAVYLDKLGAGESLVGTAWFVGLASEAILLALSKYWYRKFSPLTFLIIAGAIYAARWYIYGMITEPVYIVPLQVLNGVTFGIFYLSAFDLTSQLVQKNLHTSGHLAFYTVYFGISGIIGSLMGGKIIDTFNGHVLYTVMGTFALAGTIMLAFYYMLWYRKNDTIDKTTH